jgi:hypothetical protein
MKKLTWTVTFSTTAKYSAEISDEDAKLFEENPDEFFDTVDYDGNQELMWEDFSDEDTDNFEIEDGE